jgi:hypothetical protein
MLEFLKHVLLWLKSVYSDNGVGSSTRVHIGALVAFVLGTGLSFAVAVHLKHMTIEQFNNFLGSSATFLVTTSTPLYAANQAGSWLQKKEDNKQSGV